VELCKWTVDIGPLPSFQENASAPAKEGFYTGKFERKVVKVVQMTDCSSADFEIGLELDGAEVRGILLYEGQELGRVVFDMLS
jgi:hypothetical protein